MSLRSRILDGVSSLMDKVAADDTPLSHVRPEALQAELERRVHAAEQSPHKPPGKNPRASIAGPGADNRQKRAAQAAAREKRVHAARAQRARAEKKAQDDAFRRFQEEARRKPPPRSASSASSSSSSSSRARSRAASFGFGRDPEIVKAYKTLDLPYGAEFSEVKAAYRKLMRKYHPDLHSHAPKKQKAATELTMQVTQAYNALERHLNGK